MKKIVQQDMERIYNGLTEAERAEFWGSTVLFTGGAGFLGFYFIQFLTHYRQDLGIKKVICLDNFQVGCPQWLKELSGDGAVELHKFNVITDDVANVPGAEDADYIYHMASIASRSSIGNTPLRRWTPTSGGCAVYWTSTAKNPSKAWHFTLPARSTETPPRKIFLLRRATVATWTAKVLGPATTKPSGLGRPCVTCSTKSTPCPSPSSDPSTFMVLDCA